MQASGSRVLKFIADFFRKFNKYLVYVFVNIVSTNRNMRLHKSDINDCIYVSYFFFFQEKKHFCKKNTFSKTPQVIENHETVMFFMYLLYIYVSFFTLWKLFINVGSSYPLFLNIFQFEHVFFIKSRCWFWLQLTTETPSKLST